MTTCVLRDDLNVFLDPETSAEEKKRILKRRKKFLLDKTPKIIINFIVKVTFELTLK